MYKLICSNLTNTKESLRKFTSPCRNVVKTCEAYTSIARRKSLIPPKAHLSSNGVAEQETSSKGENVEEDNEMDEHTPNYELSLVKRMTAETGRNPLLSAKKHTQNVRPITCQVSSRFFCQVDQSKNLRRKTFKNREAVELYKNALQQCNQIRHDNYRASTIYRSAKWFPRPMRPGYSWEDSESISVAEEEVDIVAEPQTPKPHVKINTKKMAHIIQGRKTGTAPTSKEIETIGLKKPHNQFKNKKFRITYPSHTVNYKIGLKPYHLEQLISTNQEEKTYEEITKVRNNVKGTSQAEKHQLKYKTQPNLAVLMKLKKVANSSQAAEIADDHTEKSNGKHHPAMEKAKITINKCNKLFSKIFMKSEDIPTLIKRAAKAEGTGGSIRGGVGFSSKKLLSYRKCHIK